MTTSSTTVTITTNEIHAYSVPTGTGFAGALALTANYAAAAAPTVVTTDGSAAVAAATYTTTVDASKIGGSTEMEAINSTGTVSFTNMVSEKAVVEGNGSLTNGNTNFTYKATATSTNIEVQNGVTAGDITIDASAATAAATSAACVAATAAGHCRLPLRPATAVCHCSLPLLPRTKHTW